MIVFTKRKLTIDLITCHMKAQAMIERPFHNRLESYEGLFRRYDREVDSQKTQILGRMPIHDRLDPKASPKVFLKVTVNLNSRNIYEPR